ncbi:putative uncharacterized protein DDB_G0271606 [Penaeus chinensis]|uniref:putative uncharacterized protein DDB_G0271606 n=1 Tax=Penaeus chinensis TaxID=139456 RepID=UPI001FB79860|nr:putative uncharacterized protein DDB_G0271606 [Penaeus chinensis]
MKAVVVLVASLAVVVSGQEVDLDLSRGPADADSSIQLDSRGGVAIFQGAFPKEGLLAVHERLTESYENEAEEARRIFDETLEPVEQVSPYQWAYEVHAASTGDQKSQVERREEDGVVRGSYSLVEPDGSRRTVTYVAHPEEGFQATVETEPSAQGLSLQNPVSDASQNSFHVAPTQQQGYSVSQYHGGNRHLGHLQQINNRQQQLGNQREFSNLFQQQQFNGFGKQELIYNAQQQQNYGRLHLQSPRQPPFINQVQYANQGQGLLNNQNQYLLQQQQLRQQQQLLNQQRQQQQQQFLNQQRLQQQQQFLNQQRLQQQQQFLSQQRLQQQQQYNQQLQQQYERRRSQIIKLQPKVGTLPPIFGHQHQHGGQQQHFSQQQQQYFTQQRQPFIGQQPRFRSHQAAASSSAQSEQPLQGSDNGPVEYAVVPVTLHRIDQ